MTKMAHKTPCSDPACPQFMCVAEHGTAVLTSPTLKAAFEIAEAGWLQKIEEVEQLKREVDLLKAERHPGHAHCITPCDSIRIQDQNHSTYLSLLDMISTLRCPSCDCKFGRRRCGFCEGWMASWVSAEIDAVPGEDLRERLARLCHEQWSGWMKYLFEKTEPGHREGSYIPKWADERWRRQMNTPYEKLTEEEKDSDRKEADRFLNVISQAPDQRNPPPPPPKRPSIVMIKEGHSLK